MSMTYDAVSGEVLVRSALGFSGQDAHPETHTTTVSLYDGTEAAAFSPGGNFDAAWESKPQPLGSRKSVDGPRTDLADVTQYVYYPIDRGARLPCCEDVSPRFAMPLDTSFEWRHDVFGHATDCRCEWRGHGDYIRRPGPPADVHVEGGHRLRHDRRPALRDRSDEQRTRTLPPRGRWRRRSVPAVRSRPTDTTPGAGSRRWHGALRRATSPSELSTTTT